MAEGGRRHFLALCNAQLHLQTAYKELLSGFLGWFSEVQVKKESGKKLYDRACVNGNITLQSGKLKLPKAGWIHIKQHRNIDDSYILKGATGFGFFIKQAESRKQIVLYFNSKPEFQTRFLKFCLFYHIIRYHG